MHRRKPYPASLRRSWLDLLVLRHTGDDRVTHVSQREAQQAVRQALLFVRVVTTHLQWCPWGGGVLAEARLFAGDGLASSADTQERSWPWQSCLV